MFLTRRYRLEEHNLKQVSRQNACIAVTESGLLENQMLPNVFMKLN